MANGGTSVAGSFVQTVVLTDVATGWIECVPILVREGALVVEALSRARALFPFPLKGVDFDNDSGFMNDLVVPWCREQGLEVTRARAYRKNDQAWVEQKNGAIVRRLVGYGRLEGLFAVEALARLYAASRLLILGRAGLLTTARPVDLMDEPSASPTAPQASPPQPSPSQIGWQTPNRTGRTRRGDITFPGNITT